MMSTYQWWFAIRFGDVNTVKELFLEHPSYLSHVVDDLGRSCLGYAITQNNFSMVETLIALGADLNAKDKSLSTPLMIASNYSDIESMKLLLLKGADATLCDSKGFTALMRSSSNGSLEGVHLLLDAGVNPNDQDYRGCTALIHSCNHLVHTNDNSDKKVIEFLLHAGADINFLFQNKVIFQYVLGHSYIRTMIHTRLDVLSSKNIQMWKKYRLQSVFN